MEYGEPIVIAMSKIHNPNTVEETAKFLTKIIAESMANQIISRKIQLENIAVGE